MGNLPIKRVAGTLIVGITLLVLTVFSISSTGGDGPEKGTGAGSHVDDLRPIGPIDVIDDPDGGSVASILPPELHREVPEGDPLPLYDDGDPMPELTGEDGIAERARASMDDWYPQVSQFLHLFTYEKGRDQALWEGKMEKVVSPDLADSMETVDVHNLPENPAYSLAALEASDDEVFLFVESLSYDLEVRVSLIEDEWVVSEYLPARQSAFDHEH